MGSINSESHCYIIHRENNHFFEGCVYHSLNSIFTSDYQPKPISETTNARNYLVPAPFII